MAENVNFIQGRKEQYNPSEMQGGLFFSKDSKEILLNGESYGNAIPADEEDITAKDGNLKLKDRTYDEANFSGKGYKILRKNIQDGKNILTQDMINEANTVYEVRYNFMVQGILYMRENSYFVYNGGTISTNANNRIVPSKNTVIDTSVLNPFIGDYKYSGNTILVNSPTTLISSRKDIITQQVDLILNQDLDGDYSLNGYYTTQVYGPSRFKGSIKYQRSNLLRGIYLSEFIKNQDNTYNTINSIPNLTEIYNKIKNIFSRDSSYPKTIIVDVQEAIITDTIQLDGTLNLLCASSCILSLGDSFGDSEQRKNVFEFSSYSQAIRGFIDGFILNIKQGQYIDCFCKLKAKGNTLDMRNIKIGYGLTSSQAQSRKPYNHIFKIDTEGYTSGNPNPDSYCDFLTFYNVQGISSTDTIDVVVGFGDCCSFEKCARMNVFCGGGQKSFKECMHLNVYGVDSIITIQNNHNEQAHYSFSQCYVTFTDSIVGDATGQNAATITLNDTSMYSLANTLFDCTENQYFNNISEKAPTTYLNCVNTIFSFNDVSECNGFRKNLYDIESKNSNYRIRLQDSYHTLSWLDKTYYTQVYTNDLLSEITFTKVDFSKPTFSIYQGEDYSVEESWATYSGFQEYFQNLQDDSYSIEITNMLVLFSSSRLIGGSIDINYQKADLLPTKRTSFMCENNTKLQPGNYVFNLLVDGSEKYVVITITDSGSITRGNCSKYQLLGRTYLDGHIQNYNPCSRVESLGSNNIRAYLDELPKYGEWKIGDQVILNSNPDSVLTFDGEQWRNEDGTLVSKVMII